MGVYSKSDSNEGIPVAKSLISKLSISIFRSRSKGVK